MDWKTTSTVLERLHDFEDHGAWGLLLDHFETPLARLGKRMGLAEEDARDAAQETLLAFSRAYRAGEYDRGRGRLKSWMFGIARRQILGARRRRAAGRDEVDGFLDEISSGEPEPADIWEEEWRRTLFQRCLEHVRDEVTPRTFEIFHLLVREGQTPEQVAETTGASMTIVYNSKHRVARRIGELVQRYEDA